ncbi:hypothetical protein [Streptomyces blattellae]|uniref:hypothetical protein n=1 Tax=Streptomyces blattellae TaxID=2569855 RepID=UPI001E58A41B|nr:hypothetical protein [Streptomyces blattellae]
MSRPSEYGSAQSAHPEGGDLQGPPNVYHPQEPATPAYDGYADPAAAHGWQDTAYDETAQLPPVADGVSATRSGHRGRHRPLGLRSRRVLVAAGAAGVVSAAAVIAAFSFSGSGGTQGKPERTGPTADDSAAPTDTESSPGTLADRPGSSAAPASPATSAPPSPTATADATDGTREPSASATSTPPTNPTPTSTSATAPGNSDEHPGQGQGSTKKPR